MRRSNQVRMFEQDIKILKYSFYSAMFCVFCFLGAFLNLHTVIQNEGRMPVYSSGFYVNSETHFTFNNKSDVELFLLTDIIDVGFGTASIGDFMIVVNGLGALLFSFLAFKEAYKRREMK